MCAQNMYLTLMWLNRSTRPSCDTAVDDRRCCRQPAKRSWADTCQKRCWLHIFYIHQPSHHTALLAAFPTDFALAAAPPPPPTRGSSRSCQS